MKKVALMTLAVFGTTAVFAQIDFTGIWVIKEKQHLNGPEYANELPKQIKVVQRSDTLIIEGTSVGNGGVDVTGRLAFPINGQVATSFKGMAKRSRTLNWSADKKTLKLTIIFYKEGSSDEVELTRVETWMIEDGQLKVNKKSIETSSENWETNGVFTKQ